MVDYVSTNALSMLGGDDYGDITADIAALDASVVHRTGNLNETINGVKTFTSDFVINNANTDIISSVDVNISAPVVYLNGTQNRVGSSLAVGSTSVGNKIDCVGGYNLITSGTTSATANLIEATGGGSNGMTTTGAGNNVLNAQGTGKNFLISQTSNNEIQAGNANLMLIGTTEKLNMTSTTTTLTNPNINLNGALTVTNNGAPVMRLNGDNISGLYFAFHPEGTSRRAYMGFPNGGVVNFVTSNEYTNGTISNIINAVTKMEISTSGTVLTNGGHRIVSTTGDSEIEGVRIFNTFYTGGSFNVRFYNGSFSAAKYEINSGSTTLTNSSHSIISTANNIITTSGGENFMNITAGNGANVLQVTSTTAGAGNKLLAAASANGFNQIIGWNNYYDVNTSGAHYIRVNGTNRITIGSSNTTIYNTSVFFTMGDQFSVSCFNNRIDATSHHFLKVDGVDKLTINSTTTTLSNATINIDATSLVALKIGGVQKIGSSSVSSTLNNQEIYITGSSLCYTEVNSKIRIYNQSDRNEYRFNPVGANYNQVWRLYDNGTANVLYLLQGTGALNGVYLAAGANGWSGWSDERIKKNIKPIDTALTDILKLNPVFYNYKADDETLPERVGFIAQEVQQVYPDIINESKMDNGDIKNLLGLDMTNLVPYLVKAIQDLNKKLDEQALIIQELVLKTSSL